MIIKTIAAFSTAVVFAVLGAAAVMMLPAATVSAQSNDRNSSPAPQPAQSSQSKVTYHYVAQPGDSYSQMARKAVQTYGKKYRLNLSLPRILFAETNLTQEAGSPFLTEGQKVSISESAIKQWVDKARALDAAAVALWEPYVAGVDFNTDHVGEK